MKNLFFLSFSNFQLDLNENNLMNKLNEFLFDKEHFVKEIKLIIKFNS